MAISISEFWRLLMESRLLTHEQCQHLSAEFGQANAGDARTSQTLAEWLIARNVITGYQSKLLLAGRPGPFFYGEYVVYDRVARPAAGMFQAIHMATGHPVLLRFLAGEVTDDPAAWHALAAWIGRECEVVHPRLQRSFELVDLDNYKFVVLEDVPGRSLAECITEGRRPVPEACRIVRDAALALHDLHAMGHIHGDVRPKTVVLEGGYYVKLLRDFGSPPGPFPWGQPDSKGELLDRTNYLAPEMSQTGRPPEVLTDIYALGCMLYEALAGQPPFVADDMLEKMQLHASARIASLDSYGVPPALGQIVAYLMAKNPQLRFQEAANAAEQLAIFVDPAQLHSYPPAPAATLAAFESHLQRKCETARQQQFASRRAPVAGSTAAAPAPPHVALRPAAAPRVASVPDFGFMAKESPSATAVAAPPRAPRRKAELSPEKLAILLGSIGAMVVVILIGLSFIGRDQTPEKGSQVATNNHEPTIPEEKLDEPESGGTSAKTATGATPATEGGATAAHQLPARVQEIVPDDGQLLWASPTSGPPFDLKYSPPGAQIFFVFRPAEILASPHGQDAMKALGPRFEGMVKTWESAAGVRLSEVDQLVVSLHENSGQAPRVAGVVRLKEPLDEPALLSRWGNPPSAEGDAAIYAANGWSFFIPKDEAGVFLMGSPPEVTDVANNPQARPLMRREMERLLRATDSQRHATALVAPTFLFFDAEMLFAGDMEKLKGPLQDFLGDGLNGVLGSVHFGDRFYVEMRLHGTLDREKTQLASEMRARLAKLPDEIEDYVARLVPHPYWRKLALRFPPMIRFLHQQTRIGAEADHAVINAILPGVAAPNLLAASELTLVSQPGAAYVAETAPGKPVIRDIHDLLGQRYSISFPQQALDIAMGEVATEVRDSAPELSFPFEIKILGSDLQLAGITQNQSIRDFDARDKSLAEILTMMVMKANPITTVKTPNEVDQKLIWVIGPDPVHPAQNIVLITTRDAAAAKNYTLPEAFR
jgi:eukaryotic-like serine/threonine-protein kinase